MIDLELIEALRGQIAHQQHVRTPQRTAMISQSGFASMILATLILSVATAMF